MLNTCVEWLFPRLAFHPKIKRNSNERTYLSPPEIYNYLQLLEIIADPVFKIVYYGYSVNAAGAK